MTANNRSRARVRLVAVLAVAVLVTILSAVAAVIGIQVATSGAEHAIATYEQDLDAVRRLQLEAAHAVAEARREVAAGDRQAESKAALVGFASARERVRLRADGRAVFGSLVGDAENVSEALTRFMSDLAAHEPSQLAGLDDRLRSPRAILDTDADDLVRRDQAELARALAHDRQVARHVQITVVVLGMILIAFTAGFVVIVVRELERVALQLAVVQRPLAPHHERVDEPTVLR